MYSYSESSGSGFRLTYSETFDSDWTGGGIEGLEEILQMLQNENTSLAVETTLSVYFDANNKLTGTEATLNIVLSSQDSSAPARRLPSNFIKRPPWKAPRPSNTPPISTAINPQNKYRVSDRIRYAKAPDRDCRGLFIASLPL